MKSICLFSGGLDSTVLLYDLFATGDEVEAISIHYGQRHVKEFRHAAEITRTLGIYHRIVDLSMLRDVLQGSSQTSDFIQVPEGHYAAESMKLTVVPNRNMILLAVAGGFAVSRCADRIAYAAHAGDHAIYPDCRPEFVEAMKQALGLCDWQHLSLHAPFLQWTKAQIVQRGAGLNVPFAATWSCYKGTTNHCGKCGTCVERREAFELAGVPDPTLYEDVEHVSHRQAV